MNGRVNANLEEKLTTLAVGWSPDVTEHPRVEKYAALLEIAKLLLDGEEPDQTAQQLFHRLVTIAQADRGFIVVGRNGAFESELTVNLASEETTEQRRFSRSLIKMALDTRQPIVSSSVLEDPRFARTESIEYAGAHALLVIPLTHEGETFGVLYFDRTRPNHPFSDEVVRFLTDFAGLAALFLRRAVERRALRERNASLEHDLFARFQFPGIVGRHPSMLRVLELVGQVAPSDATVLIAGETGTGKELIARALHVNSARQRGPFVTVHCAALPTTLLESELFGHTRGAFTGAEKERTGRVAAANGGTLFLDEIGEVSPEVQAKLLRFLQFGEVQRPGSDRTEKVDVRVVAATHRDLKALVAAGSFRQDLYYRLKVLEVRLPPLRDRLADIPTLTDTFLKQHWKRPGPTPRFTAAALRLLEGYEFPGNIRELEHFVQRACVLTRGPDLDVDLLPEEVLGDRLSQPADSDHPPSDPISSEGPTPSSLESVRQSAQRNAEREYLVDLLKSSNGNISQASRQSGIHRSYLQRLMTRHGLR